MTPKPSTVVLIITTTILSHALIMEAALTAPNLKNLYSGGKKNRKNGRNEGNTDVISSNNNVIDDNATGSDTSSWNQVQKNSVRRIRNKSGVNMDGSPRNQQLGGINKLKPSKAVWTPTFVNNYLCSSKGEAGSAQSLSAAEKFDQKMILLVGIPGSGKFFFQRNTFLVA